MEIQLKFVSLIPALCFQFSSLGLWRCSLSLFYVPILPNSLILLPLVYDLLFSWGPSLVMLVFLGVLIFVLSAFKSTGHSQSLRFHNFQVSWESENLSKYLRRTLQFHYNHYLCNHPQGNAWRTYPGTTLFQRWSFSVVITKPKASAGMFWWGSTQRRPATLHLPIEEKSKIIFFCLCDAQIFCFSIRSMWCWCDSFR